MTDRTTGENYSAEDLQLWFGYFGAALQGTGALMASGNERPNSPEAIAKFCGDVADEAIKEVHRRRGGEREYQAVIYGR